MNRCTAACRAPSPAMAHCAAEGCHRTFGSVGGFDRHRRNGTCLDPASLGMVERDRVWRTPMPDDVRDRLADTA